MSSVISQSRFSPVSDIPRDTDRVSSASDEGSARAASNVQDLGIGSFGQEVKDIQQRLANAGFDPGPIDGDFGPLTKNAQEQFQRSEVEHLLSASVGGPNQAQNAVINQQLTQLNDELSRGVAGEYTQTKLENFVVAAGSVLEVGSRGPEVTALQEKLAAAGYNPGPIDGIHGPLTQAAVKSLQFNAIAESSGNDQLANEYSNDVVGIATQVNLERAQPLESVEPVGSKGGNLDAQVEAIYEAVPADIKRAHPEVREDIGRILQVAQEEGLSQEQIAYVIATATHENNLGFYPEEIASGAAYEGRSDLGNTQPGDGVRFKGRGYVQITGRRNYEDWSQRLGVDLVSNPELAADKDIAAQILVIGMRDGTFTGRSLDQYVNENQTDFTNARRVVNGTDKASLFAGSAQRYNTALESVPAQPAGDASVADPSGGPNVRVGSEGDSSAHIWKKAGANISNLDPKVTQIFDEIVSAWDAVTDIRPVITSGNDSRHVTNSFHYVDQAIDLRANNLTDVQSAQIEKLLQDALGSEYRVDFEHFPNNTSNDHIHIAYRGAATA